MPRFRNITDDTLFVPEGAPQTVAPDSMFTVPEDRADAFEASPHFAPAPEGKTKSTGKGGE